MAYHTTILRQIIEIFPRHEFDALAKDYHRGQKFRSFNRWTQFMVMFIGQLSGRKSLRFRVGVGPRQHAELSI